MSGALGLDLPRLEVVPLSTLVLHEDADERRVAAMVQHLQADGVVKNPPVVSPLGDGRFVVLDGANRTSALQRIGVPDIVVQVVDYAEVRLSTWYHLVTGATTDTLGLLGRVRGLRLHPSTLTAARRSLAKRESLAFTVALDGRVTLLLPSATLSGDNARTAEADFEAALSSSDVEHNAPNDPAAPLTAHTAVLRSAVATYKGLANIQRVQTDHMDELAPIFDHIALLVVFPTYRPADILALARADEKLPTGITRHLIPRRALRVNTELSFLWSEAPLAEKSRWLAEWTRHRLQARGIRFYEESTFLYDE